MTPDDIPFLVRDIENEMPVHTEHTAKIPYTFKKMPKNLMEESHLKLEKYFNCHLGEIEEANHCKILSPKFLQMFLHQYRQYHLESGIGAHDGFLKRNVEYHNPPMNLSDPAFLANLKVDADFDLSDLKAYYKFNEASGNLINLAASVGSVDSNGVDFANTGVTQGATGLIGDAYDYDGVDDISRDGAASQDWEFMYNTTSGVMSFVGWIKNNSGTETAFETYFDNSDVSTATGCILFTDGAASARTVRFNLSKSDNTEQQFSLPAGELPSDTDWHMLYVSMNSGGNVVMSVDDGTKTTTAITISGISGTSDLEMTFGATRATPTLEFNGLTDEWSFWNRILTDAEITSLYNSGAGLEL